MCWHIALRSPIPPAAPTVPFALHAATSVPQRGHTPVRSLVRAFAWRAALRQLQAGSGAVLCVATRLILNCLCAPRPAAAGICSKARSRPIYVLIGRGPCAVPFQLQRHCLGVLP